MASDYSKWHTKQQAADIIGVSTKTIEQLAKTPDLEQAIWKRPKGMPIAVFNPGDVTRLAHERHPQRPYEPPANGNGDPPIDVAPSMELAVQPDAGRFLTWLQEQFSVALPHTKLFLTVREAAAVSGLPIEYLLRELRAGRLAAIKSGGWRIRRADLEKL